MSQLHLEGWVIGLGALLVATLMYGLVALGTEISRLRQQRVDGVRLKDLIEQEEIAEASLMQCRRLWQRIKEDHKALVAVSARLEALAPGEEEQPQDAPE